MNLKPKPFWLIPSFSFWFHIIIFFESNILLHAMYHDHHQHCTQLTHHMHQGIKFLEFSSQVGPFKSFGWHMFKHEINEQDHHQKQKVKLNLKWNADESSCKLFLESLLWFQSYLFSRTLSICLACLSLWFRLNYFDATTWTMECLNDLWGWWEGGGEFCSWSWLCFLSHFLLFLHFIPLLVSLFTQNFLPLSWVEWTETMKKYGKDSLSSFSPSVSASVVESLLFVLIVSHLLEA